MASDETEHSGHASDENEQQDGDVRPGLFVPIPEDEPHRRGMYTDLVAEHGVRRVNAQLEEALQPHLIQALTQLWDNREQIDWDAYDE